VRDDAKELDEAIAHALDVARHDTEKERIDEYARKHRWLVELRERRKLGYLAPCPSCRWKDNCVTTNAGRVSETWWCTMFSDHLGAP
jgi:hypothetical protein